MNSKTRKVKTTGLKIISVLLAVLLWFYVVNQGQLAAPRNVYEVELKPQNLAEGLTMEYPRTVSVKLWGAFQETGEIIATIDLAGLGTGTYSVPVRVKPLKGAMFTTVDPDKVKVVIKEEKKNLLNINHLVTQEPPAGYQLMDLAISPGKCLVKGEEKEVNRVKSVVCAVDLGEVEDITSFSVPLKALDEAGNTVNQGIDILPEKVMVYAIVNQKSYMQKVGIHPVTVGEPVEGYELGQVILEPEMVTIIGSEAGVKDIQQLRTKEINLTEKKESFSQEVDIIVPTGVKVYPAQILAHIEIKKPGEKEVEE